MAFGMAQCSAKSEARRELAKADKQIEALGRDIKTCRARSVALEASVKSHNDAVAAWRAEGEARALDVERARRDARKEAERADSAARRLAVFVPSGADVCARMLAVDAAVKETRR
jgi:predicted  nucleic acid-binding Zn-ribbon protein